MLAGVPVAFTFALAAFLLCGVYGIDLSGAVHCAFQRLNMFALLALPLFILLGALMSHGGLARRLIDFVNALVGRMKGGLGIVLIVSNTLFGAISGVATSALATIGSIMIPEMERHGYPRGYSTGFAISSSVLSLLIPPSTSMIIFGIAGRVSIPLLFAATVIPGLILTAILCTINVIMCRNISTIQVPPKVSFAERGKGIVRAGKGAFFILLLPLVVLGGIYGGMFTPTEAAAVSTVYALLLGFFVYRTLNLKGTFQALMGAGSLTGCIVIVFFFFFILSRVLIIEEMPSLMINFLFKISQNRLVLLLIMNIVLLITGMLMDDCSGLILAAIIYLPVAKALGLDPLHFGAIVGVNLGMGLITPPVAPLLYMGGIVGGNLPLREYFRPAMYSMIFGFVPVILLTTYIPRLSLALPHLIMAIRR